MNALRKIDFEREKYFDCDGKKYFVKDSLSFNRYRELQRITLEFGYSATFEDIFANLSKAIESYNKHDYFNMSIVLYKIQEGIKNLEQKDDPALRLCALFIDEENEDPTVYNEAMMKAKIDCWAKELEVGPFFYLATSLVPSWMPVYQLLIRPGLSQTENEVQN